KVSGDHYVPEHVDQQGTGEAAANDDDQRVHTLLGPGPSLLSDNRATSPRNPCGRCLESGSRECDELVRRSPAQKPRLTKSVASITLSPISQQSLGLTAAWRPTS